MDVPHVARVAGSDEAGFFRPAEWIPTPGAADHLEAYSWGGITSRSRSRALWIFLLPFAMLNVSGWMFPSRSAGGWKRHTSVATVRMASLLTTAVFTAMFGHLMIDLVGWQCATAADCTGTWFLGPWRWWTDTAPEGVALGVAALGLIMVGVAAIARRTVGELPKAIHADPARCVTLKDAELWTRTDVAHHLGILHLTVALALTSLFGIEAAQRLDAVRDLSALLVTVAILEFATAVIAALMVASFPRFPPIASRLRWVVLAASLIGLVVTVIAVFVSEVPGQPSTDGSLLATSSTVIFVVFVALFLAFWLWYVARAVAAVVARRLGRATGLADARRQMKSHALPGPTTPSAPADSVGSVIRRLRRWTTRLWVNDNPPVMTLQSAVPFFGAGIVVTVGASVLLRTQSLLGTDLPDELLNQVAVFGCGWVLLMCIVAVAGWFSAPGRPVANIAADYASADAETAGPVDARDDAAWLGRISSAESAAFITDRAETLLTIPALVVMVAVGVMNLVGAAGAMRILGAPASLMLSFLPIGLIAAFNSLYRSRSFRRTLGIVWDVSTFWPRWFHPWAPPSYGERAVEQLTRRLRVLTEPNADGSRGGVVLSAHSQGTVLATAAVAQLDPDTRSRVAVVTHGSPLNRLYARYFGEYFARDLFRELANDLAPRAPVAWRNLYRRTDYIGGPIFGPGPGIDVRDSTDPKRFEDHRLMDPHDPNPLMRGDARPMSRNHSDYYADPFYAVAVEQLVFALRHGAAEEHGAEAEGHDPVRPAAGSQMP